MSSTNENSATGSPTSSTATGSLGQKPHNRMSCIFCRIVDGNEPKSQEKILFQDEEFVVFPDIRPAAKHHLLVVTKEHIKDAKSLTTPSHGQLIQRMVDTGKKVLTGKVTSEIESLQGSTSLSTINRVEETVSKAILGFHWPPFHTISHLHLHVIAPANEIGFIGRIIFRPNSYWFVQPSWVKERLDRVSVQDSSS